MGEKKGNNRTLPLNVEVYMIEINEGIQVFTKSPFCKEPP